MGNYGKVVVGVDFSQNSRGAAERAAAVARQNGAALTLLHVVEHFPQDIPITPIPPEDIDPAAFYRQRAEADLSELSESLGYDRIKHAVVLSAKSANHEILDRVRGHPADLVVIGAHDRDAKGPLGSTALAIAAHTPCDVLIVHAGT